MPVNIPLGFASAPAPPAPGLNIPLGLASGAPSAPVPGPGLNIPLGLPSGETTAAGGLSLPFGLGQSAAGVASQREVQIVRAVAAAAALREPGTALDIAKRAKDDPAAFAEPNIDEDRLSGVLAAVDRALADRNVDPPPTAQHVAVARAVGVDPVLVAAADKALTDLPAAATEEAQLWVAAINPKRLEDAARAGAQRKQLALVPGPTQQGRLDKIEARLKTLDDRDTLLETQLKTLDDRDASFETRLKALEKQPRRPTQGTEGEPSREAEVVAKGKQQ